MSQVDQQIANLRVFKGMISQPASLRALQRRQSDAHTNRTQIIQKQLGQPFESVYYNSHQPLARSIEVDHPR